MMMYIDNQIEKNVFYFLGGEWKKLLKSMKKENKYSNVYLARVVSFSKPSLLFAGSDIELPFASEEFCLTVLINNWAYNLEKQERYHVIEMDEGYIPYEELTSLEADKKYAYELYEFNDIWERFRSVLNLSPNIGEYLDPKIDDAYAYHQELTECKIYTIDFNKFVSMRGYRSKLNDKNKGKD